MEQLDIKASDEKKGVLFALGAYFLWGILPLYWKMLQVISPVQILAHRIVWSFVFLSAIVIVLKRGQEFKVIMTSWKNWLWVFASACLITVNWGIYIWAVNTNQIVEASMGYYINPLFSVFLGLVFLRERLNLWQVIALMLASLGVIIITTQYGRIPWIALILAVTFAFYGLTKKMANLDSTLGLTFETLFVAPIALIYLLYVYNTGQASWAALDHITVILLLFSGVATALPLLLYASAANRVPLATLGFIQYLSPSLSLFLGVILFKEPFTQVHMLSFGFIWCALIIYSLSKTAFLTNLQVALLKR